MKKSLIAVIVAAVLATPVAPSFGTIGISTDWGYNHMGGIGVMLNWGGTYDTGGYPLMGIEGRYNNAGGYTVSQPGNGAWYDDPAIWEDSLGPGPNVNYYVWGRITVLVNMESFEVNGNQLHISPLP